LEGLQGEAAKDESNAEYAEASLREFVGVVFDEGIDRYTDGGDDASDQPYADRKKPGVFDVLDESAADQRGGNITDRA
jgi:hypothetical protein